MTRANESYPAFAQCLNKFETLAGLRRAIDHAYIQAADAASARWENLRRQVHDPSDEIVSVRIEARAQRGSAFLPSRTQPPRATAHKAMRPNFAQ